MDICDLPGDLLECFEKLGYEDRWRFVEEQMVVLGHPYPDVNPGRMSGTRQFEHGLDGALGTGRIEQEESVKATEFNEVEWCRFLEPLNTWCHGFIGQMWATRQTTRLMHVTHVVVHRKLFLEIAFVWKDVNHPRKNLG